MLITISNSIDEQRALAETVALLGHPKSTFFSNSKPSISYSGWPGSQHARKTVYRPPTNHLLGIARQLSDCEVLNLGSVGVALCDMC